MTEKSNGKPNFRYSDLRDWIEGALLRGKDEVRLAEGPPQGPSAPRRWLDVSRVRHLDRGRDLRRLGVAIASVPGDVRIGDEREGICAPDCVVKVSS